jgi:hypothetical protein
VAGREVELTLTRVTVNGVGRLVDTALETPGKLLCIVGPNEAGKSTLLAALADLESSRAIPRSLWPRGKEVDESDTALVARFRLEASDFAAVSNLPTRDRPQWLEVGKRYSGENWASIIPGLRRDPTVRTNAARRLTRFLKTQSGTNLPRSTDGDAVGNMADAVASLLNGDSEPTEDQLQVVDELADLLSEKGMPATSQAAADAVAAWSVEVRRPHPSERQGHGFTRAGLDSLSFTR